MSLQVTMQPVVLSNVSLLRIVPNNNGTFTGVADYVVVDQNGSKWKENRYTFQIANGSNTLAQLVAIMLTGMNQQEGIP